MGILPRFDAEKPETRRRRIPMRLVVQRAVEQLKLPKPSIRTSPDEDLVQVVQVPTWMWVEHSMWEPVAVATAAGDVKVTATARPRAAVWSMGDGAEVVCRGPGTPYSNKYSPKDVSPDCGHIYRRASISLAGGAYRVSVRVIWDVQWHGGGQSGVVPGLVMSAERRLVVAEVQAVATR